jgi:chromosomal replication initiator protein
MVWWTDLSSRFEEHISKRASMRDISECIARKYGLKLSDLRGPSARRIYSRPRQEAYAAIHKTGRFSFGQIAKFFGRSDHTTVLKGIRAHERRAGR